MPIKDPPWPGPLQPWDFIPNAASLPLFPSPIVPMTISPVSASLSWTCKHCRRKTALHDGWCCDEAKAEAMRTLCDSWEIDAAIALLERNGYTVERREPPPDSEPWTIDADA